MLGLLAEGAAGGAVVGEGVGAQDPRQVRRRQHLPLPQCPQHGLPVDDLYCEDCLQEEEGEESQVSDSGGQGTFRLFTDAWKCQRKHPSSQATHVERRL